MAETIRDVAYDEALRSINAQAGVLDELRGRTGTLLAAASLVTSFLGGAVLASPTLENGVVSRPPIGDWGWFAIGAFCAIGVLSLLIVWPYTWRFEMDPLAIATSAQRAGLDDQSAWPALRLYLRPSRGLLISEDESIGRIVPRRNP